MTTEMTTRVLPVAALLVILALIGYRQSKTEKISRKMETPSGTVVWKEWQGDTMATVFRELTADEIAKLDRDADRAAAFIEKYVEKEDRRNDVLENLDSAFAGWMNSPPSSREPQLEVISVLGAAYGRFCIQELGLRWAIVRDAQGITTALIGDRPQSQSFPFSSIQYRIEDHETDFFIPLFVSLQQVRQERK